AVAARAHSPRGSSDRSAPRRALQRTRPTAVSSPVTGLLILAWLVGPCLARGDAPVDFGREVAPIFEGHCLRCHRPGNTKGKLSLATIDDLSAGAHVVAGQPDESTLLDLVTAQGPNERPEMPKEGKPLAPEQV